MNLVYDIIARLFGWDEIKVLKKEIDGKNMGFILPPRQVGTIIYDFYEIDPTKEPFPLD